MALTGIAGWIAPAATMIAAMMTAANLGARVTGWGFVVFVAGSVCWSIVGMTSGQTNLLLTNGFLTLVNVFGVWRWLGRQARYDEGSERAAQHSKRADHVPTLFAAGSIAGSKVLGPDHEEVGTIVDAMMTCDKTQIAYIVVSQGGVGGVGETLHAVDPANFSFTPDGVKSRLSKSALAARPALVPDQWPRSLAEVDG
jgi:hypothetical protein